MTRSENSLLIKYVLIISFGTFPIKVSGSDKIITNPAIDPRPTVSTTETKNAPMKISNK